jgi:hypothetical protein
MRAQGRGRRCRSGRPRPIDADLARLGVDGDVDVLVTGDTPICRLDRLLDGPDQLLSRDLLFGVQLEEGTDEVSTHDGLRCGSFAM